MVFCKLSDKVEIDNEKFINKTKKKINKSISDNLTKVKKNTNKINDKILEKKKTIENTIIKPYTQNKSKNKALLFIIDICIVIVLGLFSYKMYPLVKKYFKGKQKYTAEQYKKAQELPETAYSREELRKVQEFRKSFQDWIDYYKQESGFSDSNLGKFEIQTGNLLRGPFIFIIQYVAPFVIVAYMIWFIIKYIKYVIAAIWGFFIAIYQFITKKITCTLAEKWYIRLVTGWEECDPKFSQYLNSWQNNYIKRPIAQERINYLRSIQQARQQYQLNYGAFSPYRYGMNLLNTFLDWFKNLKLIYIDLPLNELYLQIIDFHPTYIVKPYSMLGDDLTEKTDKIKGDSYPSKTKKGKVCKCPPRKTLYKKLDTYLKDIPKKTTELSDSITRKTRNISNITKNTTNKLKDTELYDNINKLTSCDTYDNALNKTIENSKNIGKITWIILFLITIAIVVYSIFFQYPNWIKKIMSPVFVYVNSYVPTYAIQGLSLGLGISYIILFLLLGYVSFKPTK